MDPRQSEQQLKAINLFFIKVLSNEKNNKHYRLLKFIRNRIRQFNLTGDLTIVDVLSESYFRARKATRSGTLILNIHGWIRSVCLNIIREQSRERSRNSRLIQKMTTELDTLDRESWFDETAQPVGWSAELVEAWQQLRPMEQRIIRLRILKDLSWEKIAEDFQQHCNHEIKTTAARKRGQRALSHFRSIYLSCVNKNSHE